MMRKTKYDLPKAGNMMELTYDCQMETDAFRHANSCSISPLPKGNVAGVNITSKSEESFYHGIREAVMSWWRVVTESGPTKDVIFESKYVNTSTASFTEAAV
ncbi:unnamed protein product [Haemonchus placei]|uniref:SCP domain-containing protein n=1 Tax=Haemonchus placei TaxID=6290 RepID=A0A0N4X9R0_HAEPC|nr:unnamed protein product [Haemonchus placei]